MMTLKRHPIPIQAHFDYSLVLTYALPEAVLRPLLPPGLVLDTYEGFGFVAIALVQTRALRPVGLPAWMGRDFFLSGYRIFCRFQRASGQKLRGLKILRSDTDSRLMTLTGNALTHYHYRHCQVDAQRHDQNLSIRIHTPQAEADLSLRADLASEPARPPEGSPFPDWATARKFSGPLPFTFDYEAQTHSIVLIEGVRQHWTPHPLCVQVETPTFFKHPPFDKTSPVLANAFYIANIPYRWRRGVVEPLPRA